MTKEKELEFRCQTVVNGFYYGMETAKNLTALAIFVNGKRDKLDVVSASKIAYWKVRKVKAERGDKMKRVLEDGYIFSRYIGEKTHSIIPNEVDREVARINAINNCEAVPDYTEDMKKTDALLNGLKSARALDKPADTFVDVLNGEQDFRDTIRSLTDSQIKAVKVGFGYWKKDKWNNVSRGEKKYMERLAKNVFGTKPIDLFETIGRVYTA